MPCSATQSCQTSDRCRLISGPGLSERELLSWLTGIKEGFFAILNNIDEFDITSVKKIDVKTHILSTVWIVIKVIYQAQ